MPEYPLPPAWVRDALHAGLVIPAHPLALTDDRKLDERRQRALTRYYHAAGAGGIALGHAADDAGVDGRFHVIVGLLLGPCQGRLGVAAHPLAGDGVEHLILHLPGRHLLDQRR